MHVPSLPDRVVGALRAVVGEGPAALHEPRFHGNEIAYVTEAIESTFVSSVGAFVDRFEAQLAAFTGAKHAVAVVNGTAALQVALEVSGVARGDEVLVPALSFVATAAAVVHAGGVPHFVESEADHLGLDPSALREHLRVVGEMRGGRCVNRETGRVIRAVVPMHVFGHPVDMDALLAVASEFDLAVVEDAAESLGSFIGARHTGTFGAAGTLSFNGNKTVTTGGGGAILTDDPAIARRAKHLTTTAKVPHRWAFVHDAVGYNYRMPNLNAALGCAQLEQLPAFVERKRALLDRYRAALAGVEGVRMLEEPSGCRSNYWLQALILDEAHAGERDAILTATNAAGFGTRPLWSLLHTLAPYADCPRMALPAAESLERCVVNLPSSAHL